MFLYPSVLYLSVFFYFYLILSNYYFSNVATMNCHLLHNDIIFRNFEISFRFNWS